MKELTQEVRQAEATIAELAQEIVAVFESQQRHTTASIREGQKIGRKLEKVKSRLAHGLFEGWIRVNMPFSVRQAQRYMRLAKDKRLAQKERQGSIYDDSKSDTIMSHLDAEYGLQILSSPDDEPQDEDRYTTKQIQNGNTSDPAAGPGAGDGQADNSNTPPAAGSNNSQGNPSKPQDWLKAAAEPVYGRFLRLIDDVGQMHQPPQHNSAQAEAQREQLEQVWCWIEAMYRSRP